jgi:hypothetical protein
VACVLPVPDLLQHVGASTLGRPDLQDLGTGLFGPLLGGEPGLQDFDGTLHPGTLLVKSLQASFAVLDFVGVHAVLCVIINILDTLGIWSLGIKYCI